MGISRDKMLDGLPDTAVAAPFLGMKRPAMTTPDFEAQFPLQWMAKDMDQVAEAAAGLGVTMPVSEGARKTYRQAVESGKGDEDFAGIVA
jgi:3-hydroxyisobutyrate dehydrogenase-like beta-hydroxyacid dehydrogenase